VPQASARKSSSASSIASMIRMTPTAVCQVAGVLERDISANTPSFHAARNHTRRTAGRSNLPLGARLAGGMCPCGVDPAWGTCLVTPRVSLKRGDAHGLTAGWHDMVLKKESNASRALPNLQLSSVRIASPWRTIRIKRQAYEKASLGGHLASCGSRRHGGVR
jgi:hypothetical protein